MKLLGKEIFFPWQKKSCGVNCGLVCLLKNLAVEIKRQPKRYQQMYGPKSHTNKEQLKLFAKVAKEGWHQDLSKYSPTAIGRLIVCELTTKPLLSNSKIMLVLNQILHDEEADQDVECEAAKAATVKLLQLRLDAQKHLLWVHLFKHLNRLWSLEQTEDYSMALAKVFLFALFKRKSDGAAEYVERENSLLIWLTQLFIMDTTFKGLGCGLHCLLHDCTEDILRRGNHYKQMYRFKSHTYYGRRTLFNNIKRNGWHQDLSEYSPKMIGRLIVCELEKSPCLDFYRVGDLKPIITSMIEGKQDHDRTRSKIIKTFRRTMQVQKYRLFLHVLNHLKRMWDLKPTAENSTALAKKFLSALFQRNSMKSYFSKKQEDVLLEAATDFLLVNADAMLTASPEFWIYLLNCKEET